MSTLSSNRLTTIELFCKAAETLSFTTAAELAAATPSAVSKAVRRLEDQLGVKLFDRTTRAIRLTKEGASYHVVCRDALNRIHEAGQVLAHSRLKPHGTLKISLPAGYGAAELVPQLPKYLAQHGHGIRIVATLTNAVSEFVVQGFDVAVRIGKVTDSRLVARRLRECETLVVASPKYLKRFGIPQEPADLLAHQCVDLILPDTQKPVPWEFSRGRRAHTVTTNACLAVDHPLAAVAAAVAGGGFARLLDSSVVNDIASGRLVEVLRAFRPPATPISIVYPSTRHLSINVRTFVDFLLEQRTCPLSSRR